jgi:A/G-specific adenine glycosylase
MRSRRSIDSCFAGVAFMRQRLFRWFRQNARSYPWRTTKNPWRVLVAEMMLQRTKADQVERVYRQFFKRFKSPKDVVRADSSAVRRMLVPLGLRWRISKFRGVAHAINKRFQGKVPRTRDELLTLPGVGQYVAGAVLSVAFGRREWIVDANVVRVYRRFFGIKTSKEGRRDRLVVDLAKQYSDTDRPRDANLALLDFAAMICISGKPRCIICPLRSKCVFFKPVQKV